MKRNEANTVRIERQMQKLIRKAYTYRIPKEQLVKLFSDRVDEKWEIAELNFKEKVKIYLDKNQSTFEKFDKNFYDLNHEYENAGDDYLEFMNKFDSNQRYNFYFEIICAMYDLVENKNQIIEFTDLYALLNEEHLNIDFDEYTKVVCVVEMIIKAVVYTNLDPGLFDQLERLYKIHGDFERVILGIIVLITVKIH